MPEAPAPKISHPAKKTPEQRRPFVEKQLDFFLNKGPRYEDAFLRFLRSKAKEGVVNEGAWMAKLDATKKTDKRWAPKKPGRGLRIKRVPARR